MAKYNFGEQSDQSKAGYEIEIPTDSPGELTWGKLSGSADRQIRIKEFAEKCPVELKSLIEQLEHLVKEAKATGPEASKITDLVDATEQVAKQGSKTEPNKGMLQASAQGLLEAAKALKDILPTAVLIAQQIVSVVMT